MFCIKGRTQRVFHLPIGGKPYCGICCRSITDDETVMIHYNCQSSFHHRCWRHTRRLEGILENQDHCIRCWSSFHPPTTEGPERAPFDWNKLFEPSDSDTTTEVAEDEGSIVAGYTTEDESAILDDEASPAASPREAGETSISGVRAEDGEDPEDRRQATEVDTTHGRSTDEQALEEMRKFEDGFRALETYSDVDIVLDNHHIRPNFENDRVATNANALLRSKVSPDLLVAYAIFHTSLTDQFYDTPPSKFRLCDNGPVWVPVTQQTIDAIDDIPIGLRRELHSILVTHNRSTDSPPSQHRLQRLWMSFKPQASSHCTGRLITDGPTTNSSTVKFTPFRVPQVLAVLLELRTDRAYLDDPELGLFEIESQYELGYRIERQRVWDVHDAHQEGFVELDYGGAGLSVARVLGHGIWRFWQDRWGEPYETTTAAAAAADEVTSSARRSVDEPSPPPAYESLPLSTDREIP